MQRGKRTEVWIRAAEKDKLEVNSEGGVNTVGRGGSLEFQK